MKRAMVVCVLLAAGCTPAKDSSITLQAKQYCSQRGLQAGTPEYETCVDKRADQLWAYWIDRLKSEGD